MPPRSRRVVVSSPTELPVHLLDEVIEEMAQRMAGTPEARSCEGLSFAFSVSDHGVASARYAVVRHGRVELTRDDPAPSSFHFTAQLEVFDHVLSGRQNPLTALLLRRIHLQGSLGHVRRLLRMMPSVHRAYGEARTELIARWEQRYDFRF
jgi:putative sterol carrier protein